MQHSPQNGRPSAHVSAEISAILEQDEQIVWSGSPQSSNGQIAGTLIFLAVLVFYWLFPQYKNFEAWLDSEPGAHLPIIFCVGLALVMLDATFLFRTINNRATMLAVTTRRAIVIRRFPFRRFASLVIEPRSQIDLIKGSNSCGSLIIWTPDPYQTSTVIPTGRWYSRQSHILLPDVENVAHVRSIIQWVIDTLAYDAALESYRREAKTTQFAA